MQNMLTYRFFSNTVKNHEILEVNGTVSLPRIICHPILNAMLKYSNHASAIKSNAIFSFSNKSNNYFANNC